MLPPFYSDSASFYKRKTGFDKSLPGFLYLQGVQGKGEKFFKFGVSNDWPEKRTAAINVDSPYLHTLVEWWCFEVGGAALDLETACKREFKMFLPKRRFDGRTETFSREQVAIFYQLVKKAVVKSQGRVTQWRGEKLQRFVRCMEVTQ
ncbi:GIY-YIG nuclease family protein [Microbulbifer hainanensis]|uniref:GIY-YIG nuclease family protein n=1 Tax=Microbulbifer hainanensis TaxID=2735675 RepID=UPI00186916ED|nr:GIY-YIG nuclease family protein [Microbulbifer hainanensis]